MKKLLVIIFAATLLVPVAATYYTEWLWFGEVGQRQLFLTTIGTKIAAALAVGAVCASFLYANLRLAVASLGLRRIVIGGGSEEVRPIVVDRQSLRTAALVASALAGVLGGYYATTQWLTWLSFRHATPFGRVDPVFGMDVSFFVFTLPLLEQLRGAATILLLAALAGSGLIYSLTGSVLSARSARPQLSLLSAALFLAVSFGAYVDARRLVLTPAQIFHGASYADVAARLPARRLLMVVALVGAALAAYQARSRRPWPILAATGLTGAVALGGGLYAAAIHRFLVAPNEIAKETPYIKRNIAATRHAFNLEHVEERQLSGDAALTRADIDRNSETIKNVRLWDHQPLLDTFGQMQEIRTYYDFVSVDNDRYVVEGEYRQVMLSARELNSESLPNRTWINERLAFTHGYGLTLGPVNQATREGLPLLYIKNLPPETSVDLSASEPSIYYGELSNDYVLVRTKTPEFHYPKGDDNVTTSYAGNGGVPMRGTLRKLAFAFRFGTVKILLSDDITDDSRLLFHRRIPERVATIAPFLSLDADPYLVLSGGRLYWIVDAYTATSHYPYGNPAPGGVNYVRNSVKVVVDAYHGTTTFYLADRDDPLALTLGKIFPGLLRPLDEMPADLRRHLRYPQGLFALQAAMYSTYHMTNPAVFYNKEDQWELPALDVKGEPQPLEPYYTVMRLPGEEKAEFIQILPFTPRRKDNLAAWMAARSDGDRYGKITVFQFPKQKVVFGPRQIEARINQDQTISPQITLWNQQGSEVLQGTLLVTPIEESLLYIRPLYLRSSGGKIPELKRVIVAHQNRIVMEETLDAALDRIFGPAEGAPAPRTAPPTPAAPAASSGGPRDAPSLLAARALEHYRSALQAQRGGDWARYGDEMRQVGELLEQMAPAPGP